MITLSLASASELDELRLFRARVYGAELGIQEDTYQDVFNDHLSKNIVLRDSSRLIGTVRLAFSRETQEFYISYLTVESDKRKHSHLGLLLGAFFLLMKANQLQTVRGDSGENNLEMYLTAGCRVVGPKFRKYGFMCEWTPLCYTLGTNPMTEKHLIDHALKYLGWEGTEWRFKPRVVLCEDRDSYRRELERLIATRQIFGLIPHLGRNREALSGLSSTWLDAPAVLEPEELPAIPSNQNGLRFEHFNRSFNIGNLILVRRDSELSWLAKMYGMLSGKTLVFVDDWSALNFEHPEQVGTVLLVVEPSEAQRAVRSLRALLPNIAWGVATGIDGEAVSWFLLKNYFRFIGPVQPGEALLSHDPQTNAKLMVVPFDDFVDAKGAAMSLCLDLLGGHTSHLVLGASDCFDEAILLLSCLCEAGYPVGEAVRYVNVAVGDAGTTEGSSKETLWLFGDPTLRLLPTRQSVLETDLEAVNGSWKVTLKHNGPEARVYHVKLPADSRLASTEPGGDGVHSAVYSDGSVQHLFAYARTALPDRLTIMLD
jgi:hypothetical protein